MNPRVLARIVLPLIPVLTTMVLLMPAANEAIAQEHRPGARRIVALAALADGGVAVVDPVNGRWLRHIDGLTDATFGIAVDPVRSSRAWAVAEKAGLLFELDLSTWRVKGEPIPLSDEPAKPVTAHQPVTTSDGRYVLVTVPGDGSLTVVDTTTRALSKVPMPDDPHIVDIDPATDQVFVSRRGAARGATFLDFRTLAAQVDLAQGATLTPDRVASLQRAGAYVVVPVPGAPRVVTAMGNGRFALALYGKRGPLVFAVKEGKADLVDDLDNLVCARPRAPKRNLEYLERAAFARGAGILVGTDQGIPPCLRFWEIGPAGTGLRERPAVALREEPYWVEVSDDGATAWVSVPQSKDADGAAKTGGVLTVDLARGEIARRVAIGDDGRPHSPKRMVVVPLPAEWVERLEGAMD